MALSCVIFVGSSKEWVGEIVEKARLLRYNRILYNRIIYNRIIYNIGYVVGYYIVGCCIFGYYIVGIIHTIVLIAYSLTGTPGWAAAWMRART
jgi:hypothetical protein